VTSPITCWLLVAAAGGRGVGRETRGSRALLRGQLRRSGVSRRPSSLRPDLSIPEPSSAVGTRSRGAWTSSSHDGTSLPSGGGSSKDGCEADRSRAVGARQGGTCTSAPSSATSGCHPQLGWRSGCMAAWRERAAWCGRERAAWRGRELLARRAEGRLPPHNVKLHRISWSSCAKQGCIDSSNTEVCTTLSSRSRGPIDAPICLRVPCFDSSNTEVCTNGQQLHRTST
jgi:hypothetical protein